ncbi:MAG: hypothetical protein FWB78_09230, partial [Treponema sp.]|nr:hypothetical protein [Treponema sp.]
AMSSNRSKALRDMRQALSASAIAPAGARSPGATARDGPHRATAAFTTTTVAFSQKSHIRQPYLFEALRYAGIELQK